MAGPQTSTAATPNENSVAKAFLFAYAPNSILAGQVPGFSDTTGSRLVGSFPLPSVASGAATVTLTAAQNNQIFLLDAATGVTYTLPAPQVGLVFDFVVTVSVTSNNHKIITDASTTFLQGALTCATIVASVFQANGTTARAITMNGTTTGGLIGTHLSFYCLNATQWQVDGVNFGSGTVATPVTTS